MQIQQKLFSKKHRQKYENSKDIYKIVKESVKRVVQQEAGTQLQTKKDLANDGADYAGHVQQEVQR